MGTRAQTRRLVLPNPYTCSVLFLRKKRIFLHKILGKFLSRDWPHLPISTPYQEDSSSSRSSPSISSKDCITEIGREFGTFEQILFLTERNHPSVERTPFPTEQTTELNPRLLVCRSRRKLRLAPPQRLRPRRRPALRSIVRIGNASIATRRGIFPRTAPNPSLGREKFKVSSSSVDCSDHYFS